MLLLYCFCFTAVSCSVMQVYLLSGHFSLWIYYIFKTCLELVLIWDTAVVQLGYSGYVHSKGSELSRISRTLFLKRDTTVELFNVIFQSCEQQKQNSIHCRNLWHVSQNPEKWNQSCLRTTRGKWKNIFLYVSLFVSVPFTIPSILYSVMSSTLKNVDHSWQV